MPLQVKRAGSAEASAYLKVIMAGEPGAGKGLTLDTPVLTPAGWVPNGEITENMELIGSDGTPTTVTGIYDRGMQDVYRVTFDDGADIVCDDEHLWSVQSRKTHYESGAWMVASTRQLIQAGVTFLREGRRPGVKWWVPLVEPVQFDKVELPVDPYLMGALLANAGLTEGHCVLTTNDAWIIDTIRARCPEVDLRETGLSGSWTVAGMQPTLRCLGLSGCLSAAKFVPEAYLRSDESSRRSLLAGLCDCDGGRQAGNRRPQYFTTSPQLRDGVVALVRSLGGVTRVHVDDRDGQAPCYTVSIMGLDPCWLPRKAGSTRPAWRAITSIVAEGRAPTRCLRVDAPDELFVVKDYVVTHNTRIASTFPNVLYAECEEGLRSVVDRNPPYVKIQSSADLNELRLHLDSSPAKREATFGCRIDTVVIDTLDEVQRILVRERLDETHKEALAIQDYGWLGDQLRGIVRNFRNLDLNVIFNIHLKTDRDEESGRTYIKAQLVGAMADELPAYVDMALLLKVTQTTKVIDGQARRVEQRLMQTSSDNNHTWIRDRTGKLPRPEFEVDLDTDYERIMGFIAGGEPIPPSVTLATLPSAQSSRQAPPVAAPKGPAKVTTATKRAAGIKEPAKSAAAPLATPPALGVSAAEPTVEEPKVVQAAAQVGLAASRPVAQRAGTALNHKVTKAVTLSRNGQTIEAGQLDPSQGLYQLGGDINKLILWKDRLLGLGVEEWDALVLAAVDFIEVIDSGKNQCWRTDIASAVAYGKPYDAGAGPRYGIRLEAFDVFSAAGELVTGRSLSVPEAAGLQDEVLLETTPANGDGNSQQPLSEPAQASWPIEEAPKQAVPEQVAPEQAAPSDLCSVCGITVDINQRDWSLVRFRTVLCREHYAAKKAARKGE